MITIPSATFSSFTEAAVFDLVQPIEIPIIETLTSIPCEPAPDKWMSTCKLLFRFKSSQRFGKDVQAIQLFRISQLILQRDFNRIASTWRAIGYQDS